ncbi:hypothetical protein PORY_000209 [Pneumocystis oryctolagi]|uniref:Uncharacterized protein n=1 Tax=Pneumocystis oryctolagi TaxID=42067 RepID=A0ACB7CF57_9ASCO|nr:hypothetical protein PORY_000209 [Pneumocystis oryctolagi]
MGLPWGCRKVAMGLPWDAMGTNHPVPWEPCDTGRHTVTRWVTRGDTQCRPVLPCRPVTPYAGGVSVCRRAGVQKRTGQAGAGEASRGEAGGVCGAMLCLRAAARRRMDGGAAGPVLACERGQRGAQKGGALGCARDGGPAAGDLAAASGVARGERRRRGAARGAGIHVGARDGWARLRLAGGGLRMVCTGHAMWRGCLGGGCSVKECPEKACPGKACSGGKVCPEGGCPGDPVGGGAWLLEATVDVDDASDRELMEAAVGELSHLRKMLQGVCTLEPADDYGLR